MKHLRKMLGTFLMAIAIFVLVPTLTTKAEGLTGLQPSADGKWYYFVDGDVNYNFTGLVYDEVVGWWLVRDGVVDFDYTGLWNDPNCGWWLISGGTVAFDYTGLWNDPNCGWWLISGGTVAFDYTGLWGDVAYGWWYVEKGTVAFWYTGLAANDIGTWYCTGGMLDFGYTGMVTVNGIQYNVANGFVTGTVNDGTVEPGNGDVYKPGEKLSGKITGGVVLIVSNENPEYALTAVEDPLAAGQCNLVMSKLTGDESQKFLVAYDSDNDIYSFLSMKYANVEGNNADNKWVINAPNSGWAADTAGNADNVNVVAVGHGNFQNGSWVMDEVASGEYTLRCWRPGDQGALGYTVMAYMGIAGQLTEGVNVQACANGGKMLTFNLVSPYSQTLASGTYRIGLADDNGKLFAMDGASVKDLARLVAVNKTGSTEQLFDIICTDSVKGLYMIRNHNSRKYLNLVNGSIDIGAGIEQIEWTEGDAAARLWYIQARGNNTYSLINHNSNQVLTVTGNTVTQGLGNDTNSQKFVFEVQETGNEAIASGVYSTENTYYRFSHIGSGVYNVYSITKGGYCTVSENSIAITTTDTGIGSKWKVTETSGKYVVQSLANNMYLNKEGELTATAEELLLTDASDSITNYAMRYDLSTLEYLKGTDYSNVQILKRLNAMNLKAEDLLDPIPKMNQIEQEVKDALSALPTNYVSFNGTTVKELNEFMQDNMGKIVQLTQDIQVKPMPLGDGNYDEGQIRIPSNVILDGNGYRLVQACADTDLTNVGIVFRYNDKRNNSALTTSSYCGVWNLTSEIPYKGCTLETVGADYISIQGNNFTNAKISAILMSKNFGETKYGVISGNILSTPDGGDTLGVHGDSNMLIIEGNTITNSGEYGLMLSYLNEDIVERVEDEIGGPHDILVRNNFISGANACAMYCLGTYQVYITDNELCNSQLEGICFDSGCIGNYFYNNEVHHTSLSGGLPGVSVDNGIYNIIDNNQVYDNDCVGIKIVRAGYGTIVVNNLCANNNHGSANGSKSNIGISIEVKELGENESHLIDVLDVFGSDSNVVYNNTILGGHYRSVAISEALKRGAQTYNNRNNVVKYNKFLDASDYLGVDFSELPNIVVDNEIFTE